MATFVHRKNTPEGPRYRVWDTEVDRYATPPLTRAEMALCLKVYIHDIETYNPEERLARADLKGTSSLLREKRDPDGPWDDELNPTDEEWPRPDE